MCVLHLPLESVHRVHADDGSPGHCIAQAHPSRPPADPQTTYPGPAVHRTSQCISRTAREKKTIMYAILGASNRLRAASELNAPSPGYCRAASIHAHTPAMGPPPTASSMQQSRAWGGGGMGGGGAGTGQNTARVGYGSARWQNESEGLGLRHIHTGDQRTVCPPRGRLPLPVPRSNPRPGGGGLGDCARTVVGNR